jgi:hypothetical protein
MTCCATGSVEQQGHARGLRRWPLLAERLHAGVAEQCAMRAADADSSAAPARPRCRERLVSHREEMRVAPQDCYGNGYRDDCDHKPIVHGNHPNWAATVGKIQTDPAPGWRQCGSLNCNSYVGSIDQAPASFMRAAARLASPLVSNLIASDRSPQRTGDTRQSHITTGLSLPRFRSSFMQYMSLHPTSSEPGPRPWPVAIRQ